MQGCLRLRQGEQRSKGVKIVWFGASEGGPKIKTTLHGACS